LIQSANNFQQLKLKSKLMKILFLEISIGHLIFLMVKYGKTKLKQKSEKQYSWYC